jgi:hypothetical protein
VTGSLDVNRNVRSTRVGERPGEPNHGTHATNPILPDHQTLNARALGARAMRMPISRVRAVTASDTTP